MKFNKKIICIFLVILIPLLILLLENKESFSLGGQGKGKKKRKAQKLAKKIATKEGIQTLRQNGIRKLSRNVDDEITDEDAAKNANITEKLRKLDNAVKRDIRKLEYKESRPAWQELNNNAKRILTIKEIKSMGLTESNVKNMIELRKRKPRNFDYTATTVRAKLNIDKVLNNRSNFSKASDFLMGRTKAAKAAKERELDAKISIIEKKITNKETKAQHNKALQKSREKREKESASREIQRIFRARQVRKIAEEKKKERNSRENLQKIGEASMLSINANMERAKANMERAKIVSGLKKNKILKGLFDVSGSVSEMKKVGKSREEIDLYLNEVEKVRDAIVTKGNNESEFKKKIKAASLNKEEKKVVNKAITSHIMGLTAIARELEPKGTRKDEKDDIVELAGIYGDFLESLNKMMKTPKLMGILEGTEFSRDKLEESKRGVEDKLAQLNSIKRIRFK